MKLQKIRLQSLLEKKDTPTISNNAESRRQAREDGLTTGWMNNRKRGAPLKITPPNKKMKVRGKAPTKVADASTTATKKTKSTKLPPKTMPLPRTKSRKYTNWKQEPDKSALACSVEAKIKGLDPQLSAGEIIIPDGTLQDNVRYAKDEAKKRGLT